MKLVIAIVGNEDANQVAQALMEGGFAITKEASIGGFLRAGNTTFMIGCEDDKVSTCVDTIRANCESKEERVMSNQGFDDEEGNVDMQVNIKVSGATVFVVNVEEFYKM